MITRKIVSLNAQNCGRTYQNDFSTVSFTAYMNPHTVYSGFISLYY